MGAHGGPKFGFHEKSDHISNCKSGGKIPVHLIHELAVVQKVVWHHVCQVLKAVKNPTGPCSAPHIQPCYGCPTLQIDSSTYG